MAPVLGYWKIRAIAEPIRYMLHHLGIEYEDRRLNDAQWKEQKYTLGLDFPNLPFFFDGDLKMTQCLAICRHIGRTNGLYGETDVQLQRQALVEQVADEYRWALIRLTYNPNFESLKAAYLNTLPAKFKQIDKYIGHGPWVAGEKLTYVDFILFETLDQHLYLEPKCLEGLENLIAYRKRFLALPNVKAYIESEKFERWPLLGNIGYFGTVHCEVLPPPVV